MRQIGILQNAEQATCFADFLITQGVNAHAEEDGDGWAVWVRDEEQVPAAIDELKEFRSNPEHTRYQAVRQQAESIRKAEIERRKRAKKNLIEMRGRWGSGLRRNTPGVFLLIAATVLAFLLTATGQSWPHSSYGRMLAFADPSQSIAEPVEVFCDIEKGQVWRLVTPIVLHGDWIHLAFNLYWLYYLGGMLEDRRGTLRFVLLVVLSAAFSNTAEALINSPGNVHPTAFGGLSGVNYALFGYIWMKTLYAPGSGFHLHQSTIIIMVAFFFLCLTGWGFFSNVANAAHAGGLFFGVAIGYFPAMWPKSGEWL